MLGAMIEVRPATREQLAAGLEEVRRAPANVGRVELIVRRPVEDQREVLDEAEIDLAEGVVGDTWRTRGSSSRRDGSANTKTQVTLMNARAARLVAGPQDRWALAGDQLYVDLDLSVDNLPPGTRLAIGAAELEVSDLPHRGCSKFSARFGLEALRFVNSPDGRRLNLRGINTRVTRAGVVRIGDPVVVVRG
jgi:hypothetical protein